MKRGGSCINERYKKPPLIFAAMHANRAAVVRSLFCCLHIEHIETLHEFFWFRRSWGNAAINTSCSYLSAATPMRWKMRQRTYFLLTLTSRRRYYGTRQWSHKSPTWTWNLTRQGAYCALTWAGRRWGAESAGCRGLARRSRRVVRQCTPCS
jgi:hypothetical protein